MSTVGFGDLVPQSDFERMFTAFVLFFGVAIFTYILDEFVNILESYQTVIKDTDEYELLARFIGILKHYNKGKSLDSKFKSNVEEFFGYKWKFDKN